MNLDHLWELVSRWESEAEYYRRHEEQFKNVASEDGRMNRMVSHVCADLFSRHAATLRAAIGVARSGS